MVCGFRVNVGRPACLLYLGCITGVGSARGGNRFCGLIWLLHGWSSIDSQAVEPFSVDSTGSPSSGSGLRRGSSHIDAGVVWPALGLHDRWSALGARVRPDLPATHLPAAGQGASGDTLGGAPPGHGTVAVGLKKLSGMEMTTNERPLMSFAILAYKQERFIGEAVAGALAQTYSPLEIIDRKSVV